MLLVNLTFNTWLFLISSGIIACRFFALWLIDKKGSLARRASYQPKHPASKSKTCWQASTLYTAKAAYHATYISSALL